MLEIFLSIFPRISLWGVGSLWALGRSKPCSVRVFFDFIFWKRFRTDCKQVSFLQRLFFPFFYTIRIRSSSGTFQSPRKKTSFSAFISSDPFRIDRARFFSLNASHKNFLLLAHRSSMDLSFWFQLYRVKTHLFRPSFVQISSVLTERGLFFSTRVRYFFRLLLIGVQWIWAFDLSFGALKHISFALHSL